MIAKFKMAADDVTGVGDWLMKYMYISTGIKEKLVRSATGRGKLSGLLEEERGPFILLNIDYLLHNGETSSFIMKFGNRFTTSMGTAYSIQILL